MVIFHSYVSLPEGNHQKKALAVSHGLYNHHGMGILGHDTSDIRLKTPWPQHV